MGWALSALHGGILIMAALTVAKLYAARVESRFGPVMFTLCFSAAAIGPIINHGRHRVPPWPLLTLGAVLTGVFLVLPAAAYSASLPSFLLTSAILVFSFACLSAGLNGLHHSFNDSGLLSLLIGIAVGATLWSLTHDARLPVHYDRKTPTPLNGLMDTNLSSPLFVLPLRLIAPTAIAVISVSGSAEFRLNDQASGEGTVGAPTGQIGIRDIRNLDPDLFRYPVATSSESDRNSDYDLIMVAIPHTDVLPWLEPEPFQNYWFTAEQLTAYWSRIKPGGILALVTGEEILYVRTLLTAFDALPNGDMLRNQTWGFRATRSDDGSPFQYLAMIAKKTADQPIVDRLNLLTKDIPVVPLFGPQIVPSARFRPLVQRQPIDTIRSTLEQELSWKYKSLIELSAVTDDRPFLFQPIRALHPYLGTIVGVLTAALVCVALFPLASARSHDNAENVRLTPVPLYLSFFALIASSWSALVTTWLYQAARFDHTFRPLTLVVASISIGVAAGLWSDRRLRLRHKSLCLSWAGLALAGLGLLAMLVAKLDASTHYLFSIVAFVAAAFTVISFNSMTRMSESRAAGMTRWAWITAATSFILGSIVALWMGQYWGLSKSWLVVILGFFGSYGLSSILTRAATTKLTTAGGDKNR